jgi:hypothetical protein
MDIQSGAVAKSYMKKGFLWYEEMRKYFTIYEEAVSHIWLCNCSILNFLLFYQCTQQHSGTYSLASISWCMLGEILSLKMEKPWSILLVLFGPGRPIRKEQVLHLYGDSCSTSHRADQWGRRLEGWPNTAARLAGWRIVPPSRVWFCTW